MAKTNTKRGLATQTFGVQNNASPGDLDAIPFGTYTRRPYGPALAGWTHGWSGDNANNSVASAPTDQRFLVSGAASTKGMICGWFYFGKATAGGNNLIQPVRLITSDDVEVAYLRINVTTMVMDLVSQNAFFTTSSAIKTVPQHKWVFMSLLWENTSGSIYTLKVLYREVGGSDEILATKTGYEIFGRTWNGAGCGTRWENGAQICARIGLPSVYSIDSATTDATYPTDITEPPTTPNTWYVSSAASGGGTGVSLAQAFTGAEFEAEMAANKFTFLSGHVVNPQASNAIVDTSALTVKECNQRYRDNLARPNGDIIYFNDASGPVRWGAVTVTLSGGVRLLSDPALGHRAEVRGCARISGAWTLISGSSYRKSITCAYPVVFEFDSTAEADSRVGRARWLTHPGGITTAAGFAAVATDGSFGTDGGGGSGTEVFVRATGSGNPGSNGKVYEVVTRGDADFLSFAGAHGMVEGLILRYTAAVGTNNSGADASLGRTVTICGDGMVVVDGCVLHAGGKHDMSIFETGVSLKQRIIITDNVFSDSRPTAYGGAGGQSPIAINGTTDGRDNQVYLGDNALQTNTGVVGSTVGTLDVTNGTIDEHTSGGAHPFSKIYAYNNILLGVSTTLGTTATLFTSRNNNLTTTAPGMIDLKLRSHIGGSFAGYVAERSR